jgi:hypothetical protein
MTCCSSPLIYLRWTTTRISPLLMDCLCCNLFPLNNVIRQLEGCVSSPRHRGFLAPTYLINIVLILIRLPWKDRRNFGSTWSCCLIRLSFPSQPDCSKPFLLSRGVGIQKKSKANSLRQCNYGLERKGSHVDDHRFQSDLGLVTRGVSRNGWTRTPMIRE